MPKFTSSEKENIRETLLLEGEKLFAKYGLKKVSVDELCKSASIAKGSFYNFYINKEELYMDIIAKKQLELWEELDKFTLENSNIEPRLLIKKVFLKYIQFAEESEILKQVESGAIDYLYRKIPQEIIEEKNSKESGYGLSFSDFGVKFRAEVNIIARALEELFKISVNLSETDPENKDEIMNILIEGFVIRTVY
ncbi:MAG: TetR/AcrR family transcriptional regulator [Defluviitaleaceae bacterium]|nr:TetR/AcrR family transcriptional regulator [Defluviitaleaceae bacterium]